MKKLFHFLEDRVLEENNLFLAPLLRQYLWWQIFMVTLVLGYFIFIRPDNWFRWLITMVGINLPSLGLLILNRRGYPRIASILLVSVIWIVVTALALTGGGIHAPAKFGFFRFYSQHRPLPRIPGRNLFRDYCVPDRTLLYYSGIFRESSVQSGSESDFLPDVVDVFSD